MDKIAKALKKLSEKERLFLKRILKKLADWDLKSLDLKRLKGHKNIYRVRKSDLRIIFSKSAKGKIKLLTIERRSENTYREF